MGWIIGAIAVLWTFGKMSRNNPAHPVNAYAGAALRPSVAQAPLILPPVTVPQTQIGDGISVPTASDNGIIPLAAPVDLAVRASMQTDSVVGGIDLYTQIQAQKVVDAIPAVGSQPANMSAWVNVFSSTGVWKWSLISDPSVSFMADISGHRVS